MTDVSRAELEEIIQKTRQLVRQSEQIKKDLQRITDQIATDKATGRGPK